VTKEEPENGSVTLRVLWRGADDTPMLLANQFAMGTEEDEINLIVGQFQKPVLIGTTEERLQQANQLGYVAVNTVARFGLTRQRAGELLDILQRHLEKYDADHKG
jgi:hypothetical protein